VTLKHREGVLAHWPQVVTDSPAIPVQGRPLRLFGSATTRDIRKTASQVQSGAFVWTMGDQRSVLLVPDALHALEPGEDQRDNVLVLRVALCGRRMLPYRSFAARQE
jgi:hypothetical protein